MSYHKDSRNENVELDYNNLRIKGPIEFAGPVSFTGNNLLTVTWPRTIIMSFGPVAYVAASGEKDPWTSPAYSLSQAGANTFSSLTPNLNPGDYFALDSVGGVQTIHQAGYYDIRASLYGTVALAAGDLSASIWWRDDPGNIYVRIGSTGVTNANTMVYHPSDITVQAGRYFQAGGQLKVSFACSANTVMQLDLQITKLR
jgi:hypothetical protein